MEVSYNWLKDYLEMDLTPAQVAEAMTSIGIEVDSLEEQEEILPCTEKYGVDLISTISPPSDERIRSIAESAKGFIYVVSSMGVTGVRSSFQYDAISRMTSIIRETNPEIPCAVGFGISTPEQAERMAAISDGVIVGSAIIRLIHGHGVDAEQAIFEYVSEMKAAVMRAGSSCE